MGARGWIAACACATACTLGCGAPPTSHAPLTSTAAPAARTLRFRRTTTGLVRATSTRESWTLDLDNRGTILHGVLERGAPSSIATLRDVAWETVGDVSYASPQRLDAANGAVRRLEKVGGDDALVLACTPKKVRVRVAGVTLVHGDACGGAGPKPHWEPATTVVVEVLHCDVPSEGDVEVDDVRSFEFAQGAGVEWVFEDSDCSAQEGSLRAMP